MRLTRLTIYNYRSIRECEDVRIEPLQAFVGENNAGKSNILRTLSCFLTSGSGGTGVSDFHDAEHPVRIEAEFGGLSNSERRRLRPYLIGDRLILQKILTLQDDPRTGKVKVATEYHGYQAEPSEWWLSLVKIEEHEGSRPKWQEIAEAHGILDYVQSEEGNVNKSSYKDGLQRFLAEHEDVEYDEPRLGETQALGLQPNLLSALPVYRLLPAITDYSDEIDRRSSSTVFRQLMAVLSDRIIKSDPRYGEIEDALSTVRRLLNPPTEEVEVLDGGRLGAIDTIETELTSLIAKLMPTVQGVQLEIEIDEPRDLFSRGVSLRVDDGRLTDVLDKGHGLQRSVVFALLQMLMTTLRNRDNAGDAAGELENEPRPIILGIEEPELYIHPQSQRLIYNVLKEFAGVHQEPHIGSDQVIHTTHSPAFVDVGNYERVGIVRKHAPDEGTHICQCDGGVLGNVEERKGFKLLTSFGLKQNELFFAREIILVEGPEDEIAFIATARKLGQIVDLPDEIGLAIVVAHGKPEVPKFQRILNAYGLQYGVLLELDGQPEDEGKNREILELVGDNKIGKLPMTLEAAVGLEKHFPDVFYAKTFFANPDNVTAELEECVRSLLPE